MKINMETDYALRIMRCIAGRDSVTDAKTVSELVGVSQRFTLKILGKLTAGGVLLSHKGANGGYELSRPADRITMRQIIEIIDGPLVISRCLSENFVCRHENGTDSCDCFFNRVFDEINMTIGRKAGQRDHCRCGNRKGARKLNGTPETASRLADTAMLAAVIILENGGETFRAEETAVRICRAAGKPETEVIALPTGIFITVRSESGSSVSSVARIKERAMNLCRVERANAYSREFDSGRMSLEELNAKADCTAAFNTWASRPVVALFAGISSAMFTLLFEPSLSLSVLFDIAVTFICTFAAEYICTVSRLRSTHQFTVTFIGSAIMALIAALATGISGIGNLGCIIIGAITPLLPGVSLTNAIRDTVMGDIVSGTARLAETVLIAIAIAGGVGIVLAAYVNITGGAL